jgi:catechol 2,3-dioxygenase-like lactoylglutathione lyase family enzyme
VAINKLTPHIVVRDANRAAEWYRDALDAELGAETQVPDGRYMQIELRFGDDHVVMIADEFPKLGAVSPQTLGGTVRSPSRSTRGLVSPRRSKPPKQGPRFGLTPAFEGRVFQRELRATR